MIGTTHIEGMGECKGQNLSVWFKNENLVSWMDDEPFVTSPDLLVITDRKTGEGILNALVEVGQQVAVIGLKGLDAFRSQKGLASAGPRYFGFDIDYVPIEEAIKRC